MRHRSTQTNNPLSLYLFPPFFNFYALVSRFTLIGPASAPGHITSLQLPDPVTLPSNATIRMSAVWNSNQSSPIKVSVDLKKKIGVWVDILHKDFDDLCQALEKIPLNSTTGQCPDPLPSMGIPCRCPITPFKVKIED